MPSFDLSAVLDRPELPTYLKQVDKKLADALVSDNPYIREPVLRLINARGKRLRPSLVIAAANTNSEMDKAVISAGVAVELVHIASLVHDDIIDDADTRWNTPTINRKEGVNQAIVIGDYLLGKAGVVAATISAEAASIVSSAIISLSDGQSLELADSYNLDRSVPSMLKAINGKTAALIAASCRLGGLCAGLDKIQIEAMANYGENFGLAFQLIDDILDLLSTPELSGKPVGNDISEGTYTLPLLLGLKGNHHEQLTKLLEKGTTSTRSDITEILIKDGSIKKTIGEVQKHNQLAVDSLKSLEDNKALEGLRSLPDAYLDWALSNQVAPEHQPVSAHS